MSKRVLTVRQPYAGLIAAGIKHYETRPKPTRHRGDVVIHAGKHWDIPTAVLYADLRATFVNHFRGKHISMVLGVTLCIVTLTDCVPVESLNPSALECAIGDYTPGRYAWILENPRPIARVEVRGQLGLWNIDDELIKEA